jgi:hypothetical protein
VGSRWPARGLDRWPDSKLGAAGAFVCDKQLTLTVLSAFADGQDSELIFTMSHNC